MRVYARNYQSGAVVSELQKMMEVGEIWVRMPRLKLVKLFGDYLSNRALTVSYSNHVA